MMMTEDVFFFSFQALQSPRHSLVTRADLEPGPVNALKSLCDLRRVVVVSGPDPLRDDKAGDFPMFLGGTV